MFYLSTDPILSGLVKQVDPEAEFKQKVSF